MTDFKLLTAMLCAAVLILIGAELATDGHTAWGALIAGLGVSIAVEAFSGV